jgi:hypothetical protein
MNDDECRVRIYISDSKSSHRVLANIETTSLGYRKLSFELQFSLDVEKGAVMAIHEAHVTQAYLQPARCGYVFQAIDRDLITAQDIFTPQTIVQMPRQHQDERSPDPSAFPPQFTQIS